MHFSILKFSSDIHIFILNRQVDIVFDFFMYLEQKFWSCSFHKSLFLF